MAFKEGVVLGPVSLNATGSANTAIGATSNNGTISIGNTSSGAIAIDCGIAGITVGTTANAHATVVGSTNSTSATTIQSGSGALALTSTNGTWTGNSGTGALGLSTDASATTVSLATGGAVKTVTLGSTNSTSTTTIACGTGGANFGTSANAHATVVGSTTASCTTTIQAPSAGVVLTGVAGVAVSNQNLVTINTSTGAIGSTSSFMLWTEVTGTSANMAIDNGYIANNGSLVTLTLPTTVALGSIIRVTGKGAGGWRIAQSANQQINFGLLSTTVGAGGRLDSTATYDTVELVCITANNIFNVISSIGNITVT